MNLSQIIKDTEQLGITVLFCSIPKIKGRFDNTLGKPCIYIDKELSDIEKVNIILHEKSHYLRLDQNNSLIYIPTYSHHIETRAEKDRISDFLSLIDAEYPIDESFNYIEYMKHANIPVQFENFIKEKAKELYNNNKHRNII